ncbi:hypothetical protein ACJJTC_019302 [Scirpophaga incertulas]
MICSIYVLVLLKIFTIANGFLHHYPKIKLGQRDTGDAGKLLFLTPYIESGNITEGRQLARVPFTEALRIKSYAGFFTVNKTFDSNQFFWYFPAMVPDGQFAPVIVWLQGGPGATSLYDNPVGTGFSFTNDPRGYCTDQTQIGEQLYSTLIQFFQLFAELRLNKFFVTGESYAGKYVPALAYTIHKSNPTARLKINLKGIAISNGLCDPAHQMLYGKYLYQLGLIDWNQASIFEKYEHTTVD